jgi:HD superfamily phosphohydrolase YqeK
MIAGIEIPDTDAAAAATRFAREHISPLFFDHSRRVFLFGSLRAAALGLKPNPELLYIAAMMHDTGLFTPFSDAEQRFEVDGADHGRQLMLAHGAPPADADVVWEAIALHTTPGIPARMGPEIAATNMGVLVDVLGIALDTLDDERVAEITAVHPRDDFNDGFLQALVDGLAHRPDTTYGTVNADVLERFVPGFRRASMVDRIAASPWAA